MFWQTNNLIKIMLVAIIISLEACTLLSFPCIYVLLVTYVFKWIGFKLDEEISKMLFPLLVFGLIPFSYVHFFILRNQVYQLYLMNRYSEKYREILGEKEVNFYGTAYQTSHEVMNRIRVYKEDKNIKFGE